jgi:uncharacterized protein YndB with AHSA1/START domain/DNA-binding transcriptional ArsR family regulator
MDGDVFQALADDTRRGILDRLRISDGQALSMLNIGLEMTRQSLTQHLVVLERANLISVVRHGRERLHYLNPVPIYDIQHRWLSRFDVPRLETIRHIKEEAELMESPDFVYTTYIEASAERVWDALTSEKFTADFWGHSNVSDWEVGSRWEHVRTDGSGAADVVGRVVESDRPHRLAMTFGDPDETPAPVPLVTFTIETFHDIVKLTIVHEHIGSNDERAAAAAGWSSVFANLKTLLETGHTLPQAPWEMHADLRQQYMAE